MAGHARRIALGLTAAASLWSAGEARQDRRIVRTEGQMTAWPAPSKETGAWPSFRGPSASGVADGQNLPDTWNGVTGENILWRTPLAGLAHSSPIVWGDRVYVTTAVSSRGDATFKPGMFSQGTPSDDRTVHRWLLYAIDRNSGQVIWEREAFKGVPIEKRHIKSTYASATPATDGRIVVAWFGSQGVYAYNMDGTLRWKVDLGHLDIGAFDVRTLEWGTAASPIIWNDLVFLQCDTHADDFVLALDARTGETVWKAERTELPSWGTPTIVPAPAGPQLVANGSNFARAYDPLTGKELWRLGPTSQITVPAPVFGEGLVVISSGRAPERPIFVVRPSARGDISLQPGATTSDAVAWSRTGRGPYMPTPLIYGGVLYVLANNGVFHAYTLRTGEQLIETRVPQIGGGFHASMVAADGKLYVSGEDGDMLVLTAAGTELKHVATNPMGEPLMATPALSRGVMYVRTPSNLFAIRQTDKPLAIPAGIARVALPPAAEIADAPRPIMHFEIAASGATKSPFAGSWEADNIRLGTPMTMKLAIDGRRVTGELIFTQTLELGDGSRVEGDRIVIRLKSPNGERTITFTGTLKGDEIHFVRTVEVAPGGRDGGAGIFGVNGSPSFTAKRSGK